MTLFLHGFRPSVFFTCYLVTRLLKNQFAGAQTDVPKKHGDIRVDCLASSGQVTFFLEDLFRQLFTDLGNKLFVGIFLHLCISFAWVSDPLTPYQEIRDLSTFPYNNHYLILPTLVICTRWLLVIRRPFEIPFCRGRNSG